MGKTQNEAEGSGVDSSTPPTTATEAKPAKKGKSAGSRLRSISRKKKSKRTPSTATMAAALVDDTAPSSGTEREVMPMGPTRFFSRRQLFVDMRELRGYTWVETHRWKFGLEEDLTEQGGLHWERPHLPHMSAMALVQLRQLLADNHGANVMLDVPGQNLQEVVHEISSTLSNMGTITPEAARLMVTTLMLHADPGMGTTKHDELDLLCQEDLEEAVDILCAEVDWLDDDILVFARLESPISIVRDRWHSAPTRFVCIMLGPLIEPSHQRHIEIGESFGALLEDEDVVDAAYKAVIPGEFLVAIDLKLHHLSMMPHIHRPSKRGMDKRLEALREEMLAVVGMQAGTEADRRDELQKDLFRHGITVKSIIKFLQKYAIMLVLGIVIALVVANVLPEWYARVLGPAHHEEATTAASGTDAHAADDEAHGNTPLFFQFSLDGHDFGLNFIVNDILMAFFFGLAAVEITESFLPGAIMNPPSKAINPALASLGGLVAPIATYFALVAVFTAANAFDMDAVTSSELRAGWGLPTATDISISWATAVLVFGRGHPAISYLLLMAILDDGVGLIIIAIFYPDPNRPTKPEWLGVCLLGMVVAALLRKFKVGEWKAYVFLAGPIVWYGLLMAALHPALALCFIVPFMPVSEADMKKHAGHEEPKGENKGEGGGEGEGDAEVSEGAVLKATIVQTEKSPLFEFPHSTRTLVDLVVLFLFGLCNAGIDLGGWGPFTGVVILSRVIGKTLGIGVTATIVVALGFPLPPGMSIRAVFMVGFIASIGLTVALVIADAAYGEQPVLQNEAKLGSLLSLACAPLAVLLSYCIDFSGAGDGDKDSLDELENGAVPGTPEDAISIASGNEECLEDVVVGMEMDQLRMMQSQVNVVEAVTKVSRADSIRRMRETGYSASASRINSPTNLSETEVSETTTPQASTDQLHRGGGQRRERKTSAGDDERFEDIVANDIIGRLRDVQNGVNKVERQHSMTRTESHARLEQMSKQASMERARRTASLPIIHPSGKTQSGVSFKSNQLRSNKAKRSVNGRENRIGNGANGAASRPPLSKSIPEDLESVMEASPPPSAGNATAPTTKAAKLAAMPKVKLTLGLSEDEETWSPDLDRAAKPLANGAAVRPATIPSDPEEDAVPPRVNSSFSLV